MGPPCQRLREKKRREGDAGHCGEGGNGLVGRWAKRVREVRFSLRTKSVPVVDGWLLLSDE
jgi:hypothetical protein